MYSLLLLGALAGTTLSQSTLATSFFLLGADPQSLVASVVSADATATTFELTCPSGTDSSDCGYNPPVNIVKENSDTWIASLATVYSELQFEFVQTCSVGTVASCYESYGGAEANFPGETTTTYQSGEFDYLPVTITAGLEKLADATQGSGPLSTPAAATSGTGTGTGTAVTVISGSRTGTGNTPTETGAGTKTRAGLLGGMVVLVATVGMIMT